MEIFFWEDGDIFLIDGDRLKWKWIHFLNSSPTLFIFFYLSYWSCKTRLGPHRARIQIQQGNIIFPSYFPLDMRQQLQSKLQSPNYCSTSKAILIAIFFFLGDILIEFNTWNHALIKTWFTKKKKKMLLLKLYYLI